MIEDTLVIIKPDAVKRGLVGEIIRRFERAGLKIVGMKMIKFTVELAEKFYDFEEEWYIKVGKNLLEKAKELGIDIEKRFGTRDPYKIGKIVKSLIIEYITSGPVVAAIIEGNNAIATTRIMIGATKSFEADPGSIRGDFGLGFSENIIHASDSQESFDHKSRVAFE